MPVPNLTLRLDKGSPLTPLEMDDNLRILRDFGNGLEALLLASINPDGSLKDGAVDREAVLVDRVVTQRKLAFATAFFAVATGAANVYAAGFTPALSGGYVEGMVFWIEANHTNTGPATLNIDGNGAISIRKNYDSDLSAGDWSAGQVIAVVYESSGPYFQVVNTLPAVPGLTGIGAALQVLRTNAGATAAEWITPYYVGALTALVAGFAAPSWTHGLGAAPDLVQAYLVLTGTDAASGYATGDMLEMAGWESGGNAPYFNIMKNTTEIVVVYNGSMALNIRKKSDGSVYAIPDLTQWQIKVWAHRFSF